MGKIVLPHGALTRHFDGRANQIVSEIDIKPVLSEQQPQRFRGIWDTGATNTVVTQTIVDSLGLIQTGVKEVFTPQGSHLTSTYLVDIQFVDAGMTFEAREVTLGQLPGDSHVLIGMDIISFGDFTVTNKDGRTTMTFRIPSLHRTDYVDAAQKAEKQISHRSKKKKKR